MNGLSLFLLLILLQCAAVSAEHLAVKKRINAIPRNSSDAVIFVNPSTGEELAGINREVFHKPYPPGSLIKVFTIISYHRDHGDAFPKFYCPPTLAGKRDGCWDRNGHGWMTEEKALGYSCNVYFRQLADRISTATFAQTLNRFGLQFNAMQFSESTIRQLMVGSNTQWSVAPFSLLRAYSSFFHRGRLWAAGGKQPGFVFLPQIPLQVIGRGMKISAMEGTSLLAHQITSVSLLGKTGTTLRWNEGRTDWRDTQGWWIGLYPADTEPEVAVMAFTPGGRGATDAARLGGHALKAYLTDRK